MKLGAVIFSLVAVGCSAAEGTITGPAPEAVAVDSGAGTTPTTPTETTDGGTIEQDTAPPPPKEPELVEVKGLSISELAIYQGVKIPLERDGSKLEDATKAHVVAGREGVLRVFVTPLDGFVSREVTAELTLHVDGKDDKVFKASKSVSAASTDETLASTINVDIPSGALEKGASYRVRLVEKPGQSGTATRAKYPADGFDALDIWETGESFKVVLVPVKSNGRIPDISPEQIERYRKILQAMYPVQKVDLKVRDVWEYSGSLGAGGSGIYGLLDAVTALRKSDGVDKDVYYYGAFTPTSSYSTYCPGGCTTGLCHLPGVSDTYLRACVGVGFTGSSSAGTMAHELGHSQGIPHAPCGAVAGADAKYPYSGGKIGAWGYDERTQTLISPSKNYDFMSYCSPEWISDYAFDRIIHRMNAVMKEAYVVGGEKRTYQFVHVLPTGQLEWGSDITLDEPMFGDPREVSYVTEAGTRGSVTGYFYPNGEDGGSVLVPKPSLAMRELRIGANVLTRVP